MTKATELPAAQLSAPVRLPTLALCAVALATCILVGGNTMTFSSSDAVAEALCVPAFVAGMVSIMIALGAQAAPVSLRVALATCVGIVALPLIQLIPLPPSVWGSLPGRVAVMDGYRIANIDPPWLGISLSPDATRQSLFSLIPGLAVFMLCIQMNWKQRRTALAILIALAVVSAIVGLVQIAQGAGSPLRFYYADNTDIAGFFANHNHLGVLFYLSILMAGVWGLSLLIEVAFNHARESRPNWQVAVMAGVLFLAALILIVGAFLTRSRAVILITAGSGVLVLALTVPFAGPGRYRLPVVIAAVVLTLGLMIGLNLTGFDLASRWQEGLSDTIRASISRAARPLISAYLPFGSGFGTFLQVYAANETPAIAQAAPINRAHNDFLEWLVEGSVTAGLLATVGSAWAVGMAVRAIRDGEDRNFLNGALRRAAAFGLLLVLVHSTVEYPLRTIALMGVTGLFAGICLEPFGARPETSRDISRRRRRTRK